VRGKVAGWMRGEKVKQPEGSTPELNKSFILGCSSSRKAAEKKT